MSLTPETFNITGTFRLSFRFTFSISSEIAFGGSVLEGTKDLGRTVPLSLDSASKIMKNPN